MKRRRCNTAFAALQRGSNIYEGLQFPTTQLPPRANPCILAPVNFAQLLFPDFSLILIGYLLCRLTALNRKVWEQVDSLVYFFLFPVLRFCCSDPS
jgi:hypothetical protein